MVTYTEKTEHFPESGITITHRQANIPDVPIFDLNDFDLWGRTLPIGWEAREVLKIDPPVSTCPEYKYLIHAGPKGIKCKGAHVVVIGGRRGDIPRQPAFSKPFEPIKYDVLDFVWPEDFRFDVEEIESVNCYERRMEARCKVFNKVTGQKSVEDIAVTFRNNI